MKSRMDILSFFFILIVLLLITPIVSLGDTATLTLNIVQESPIDGLNGYPKWHSSHLLNDGRIASWGIGFHAGVAPSRYNNSVRIVDPVTNYPDNVISYAEWPWTQESMPPNDDNGVNTWNWPNDNGGEIYLPPTNQLLLAYNNGVFDFNHNNAENAEPWWIYGNASPSEHQPSGYFITDTASGYCIEKSIFNPAAAWSHAGNFGVLMGAGRGGSGNKDQICIIKQTGSNPPWVADRYTVSGMTEYPYDHRDSGVIIGRYMYIVAHKYDTTEGRMWKIDLFDPTNPSQVYAYTAPDNLTYNLLVYDSRRHYLVSVGIKLWQYNLSLEGPSQEWEDVTPANWPSGGFNYVNGAYHPQHDTIYFRGTYGSHAWQEDMYWHKIQFSGFVVDNNATWVKQKSPGESTFYASSTYGNKHVTATFNRKENKIYYIGGDYWLGPSWNSTEMIRTYSVSDNVFTTHLSREDACQDNVFPIGRCEPSFAWDTKRNVFWFGNGQNRQMCTGPPCPDNPYAYPECTSCSDTSRCTRTLLVQGGLWTYDPTVTLTSRYMKEGPGLPSSYDRDGYDQGHTNKVPSSGNYDDQTAWGMIYDPITDSLYVPGQVGSSGTRYLARYSISTYRDSNPNKDNWSYVETPAGMTSHHHKFGSVQLAYDSKRGRIYSYAKSNYDYGGVCDGDSPIGQMWSYSTIDNTWTKLWESTTASEIPQHGSQYGMTYDVANDRVVILGGSTCIESGTMGTRLPLDHVDVFNPNDNTFSTVTLYGTPPSSERKSDTMAYDIQNNVHVLMGGTGTATATDHGDIFYFRLSGTGLPSSPSSTIPVLLTPIDNATAGWPVDFNWTGLNNTIFYHIQVDNNSNFSSPEIDDDEVDPDTACTDLDCHYIVEYGESLLPNTHYYWRVRSRLN